MQPFGFTLKPEGHAYSGGLLYGYRNSTTKGSARARLPNASGRIAIQSAAPSSGADRHQEHTAAKDTPRSSRTWRQWTSCSRPAPPTPWASTARSRPWDRTASFVSCVSTSSPAAPPYVSRPRPPGNCNMTWEEIIVPVGGKAQIEGLQELRPSPCQSSATGTLASPYPH